MIADYTFCQEDCLTASVPPRDNHSSTFLVHFVSLNDIIRPTLFPRQVFSVKRRVITYPAVGIRALPFVRRQSAVKVERGKDIFPPDSNGHIASQLRNMLLSAKIQWRGEP